MKSGIILSACALMDAYAYNVYICAYIISVHLFPRNSDSGASTFHDYTSLLFSMWKD